jgi:hypothetical protein
LSHRAFGGTPSAPPWGHDPGAKNFQSIKINRLTEYCRYRLRCNCYEQAAIFLQKE